MTLYGILQIVATEDGVSTEFPVSVPDQIEHYILDTLKTMLDVRNILSGMNFGSIRKSPAFKRVKRQRNEFPLRRQCRVCLLDLSSRRQKCIDNWSRTSIMLDTAFVASDCGSGKLRRFSRTDSNLLCYLASLTLLGSAGRDQEPLSSDSRYESQVPLYLVLSQHKW